jgi:hypothetical protein
MKKSVYLFFLVNFFIAPSLSFGQIKMAAWDPYAFPTISGSAGWKSQNTAADADATLNTPYAGIEAALKRATTAGKSIFVSGDAYIHGKDYDGDAAPDNENDHAVGNGTIITATVAKNIKIHGTSIGCGTYFRSTAGARFIIMQDANADNVEIKNIYFENYKGFAVIDNAQNVLFENCTFDAVDKGFSGFVIGKGTHTRNTTVKFKNCKFINNNANRVFDIDGNSSTYRTTVTFEGCLFTCNKPPTDGGTIMLNDGNQASHLLTVNMDNCIFSYNISNITSALYPAFFKKSELILSKFVI